MSDVMRKIGITMFVFVVGAVGGIFATEIFWPSVVEAPLYDGYRLPGERIEVNKTERVTVKENEALQDVIEETESSVVGIKGEKKGTASEPRGVQGTGFMITSDGLIVTLSSVADGTTTVVYRGEELEAGPVKTGETFTTLRIDGSNLSTRGVAETEELRLGQRVFLIGKLFEQKPLTAVNHGIVKYFDRQKIHTNISEAEALEGSPLLNIEGKVVGLAVIERGKAVGIPIPEMGELLPR